MKNLLDKLISKLTYSYSRLTPIFTFLSHCQTPQKTYAQCHEDQVTEILLGKVTRFIDIGAYDGFNSSNIFWFAINGASGLCFEPIKSTYERLNFLFLFCPKVHCICEGISNQQNSYEIRQFGPFSSIDETGDNEHREILKRNKKIDLEKVKKQEITVRPLHYWLNQFPQFRQTDLITIDVEGHELNALQGMDFQQIAVKCFIIETHVRKEWKHQDYDEINALLCSFDYHPILKSHFNTFWLHKDCFDIDKVNKVIQDFPQYEKVLSSTLFS